MTKKAWIFGVPGKQMLSNFFSSERRKRLSLRKRFASLRCRLRLQGPMFSSLLRAIFQRLAVTPSQAQAHANLGHVFDAEDEPYPETRCNQWTSMQDLTDMAMALLCQYQQCNFSPPMRLQFLWKDGREILALKASFRIRLAMVWNHLESTCNESASNSQKLEQGARLGQLCRYKRERTKTRRSSRWSLCRKACICLKEPRREIKRLLVKRATVRVSTCVRHSCVHLQGALRLSIWSICENVQTSFTWSKISRSSLQDAGMQQAAQIVSSRPVVSKHILERQCVIDTRLAAFNLLVAALHFQMTDCSIEDLEVKSRWPRTTTLCLPIIWWVYPARGCVV